jgi:hypothetical protein
MILGGRVLLIRLLTASYLLLAATSACGSARHSKQSPSPGSSEILLEVENHHWNDIVIYLMNENQSQRLGTVSGVSTDRFVFPYRQIATGGKVRLRAQPVGGQRSFTSEDVLIQSGQGLKWILESDLKRSTLTVY